MGIIATQLSIGFEGCIKKNLGVNNRGEKVRTYEFDSSKVTSRGLLEGIIELDKINKFHLDFPLSERFFNSVITDKKILKREGKKLSFVNLGKVITYKKPKASIQDKLNKMKRIKKEKTHIAQTAKLVLSPSRAHSICNNTIQGPLVTAFEYDGVSLSVEDPLLWPEIDQNFDGFTDETIEYEYFDRHSKQNIKVNLDLKKILGFMIQIEPRKSIESASQSLVAAADNSGWYHALSIQIQEGVSIPELYRYLLWANVDPNIGLSEQSWGIAQVMLELLSSQGLKDNPLKACSVTTIDLSNSQERNYYFHHLLQPYLEKNIYKKSEVKEQFVELNSWYESQKMNEPSHRFVYMVELASDSKLNPFTKVYPEHCCPENQAFWHVVDRIDQADNTQKKRTLFLTFNQFVEIQKADIRERILNAGFGATMIGSGILAAIYAGPFLSNRSNAMVSGGLRLINVGVFGSAKQNILSESMKAAIIDMGVGEIHSQIGNVVSTYVIPKVSKSISGLAGQATQLAQSTPCVGSAVKIAPCVTQQLRQYVSYIPKPITEAIEMGIQSGATSALTELLEDIFQLYDYTKNNNHSFSSVSSDMLNEIQKIISKFRASAISSAVGSLSTYSVNSSMSFISDKLKTNDRIKLNYQSTEELFKAANDIVVDSSTHKIIQENAINITQDGMLILSEMLINGLASAATRKLTGTAMNFYQGKFIQDDLLDLDSAYESFLLGMLNGLGKSAKHVKKRHEIEKKIILLSLEMKREEEVRKQSIENITKENKQYCDALKNEHDRENDVCNDLEKERSEEKEQNQTLQNEINETNRSFQENQNKVDELNELKLQKEKELSDSTEKSESELLVKKTEIEHLKEEYSQEKAQKESEKAQYEHDSSQIREQKKQTIIETTSHYEKEKLLIEEKRNNCQKNTQDKINKAKNQYEKLDRKIRNAKGLTRKIALKLQKSLMVERKKLKKSISRFEKNLRKELTKFNNQLKELDKKRLKVCNDLSHDLAQFDKRRLQAINSLNKHLVEFDRKRLKAFNHAKADLADFDKKRIEKNKELKENFKKNILDPLAEVDKKRNDSQKMLIKKKNEMIKSNKNLNKLNDDIKKQKTKLADIDKSRIKKSQECKKKINQEKEKFAKKANEIKDKSTKIIDDAKDDLKKYGAKFEKHVTQQVVRGLQDTTDSISEFGKPLSNYVTDKIAPELQKLSKAAIQNTTKPAEWMTKAGAEVAGAFGDKKTKKNLYKLADNTRKGAKKAGDIVTKKLAEEMAMKNAFRTVAVFAATAATGGVAVPFAAAAVGTVVDVGQKKEVSGASIAGDLVGSVVGGQVASVTQGFGQVGSASVSGSAKNMSKFAAEKALKGENFNSKELLEEGLKGAVLGATGAAVPTTSNDDILSNMTDSFTKGATDGAMGELADQLLDGKAPDLGAIGRKGLESGTSAAANTGITKFVENQFQEKTKNEKSITSIDEEQTYFSQEIDSDVQLNSNKDDFVKIDSQQEDIDTSSYVYPEKNKKSESKNVMQDKNNDAIRTKQHEKELGSPVSSHNESGLNEPIIFQNENDSAPVKTEHQDKKENQNNLPDSYDPETISVRLGKKPGKGGSSRDYNIDDGRYVNKQKEMEKIIAKNRRNSHVQSEFGMTQENILYENDYVEMKQKAKYSGGETELSFHSKVEASKVVYSDSLTTSYGKCEVKGEAAGAKAELSATTAMDQNGRANAEVTLGAGVNGPNATVKVEPSYNVSALGIEFGGEASLSVGVGAKVEAGAGATMDIKKPKSRIYTKGGFYFGPGVQASANITVKKDSNLDKKINDEHNELKTNLRYQDMKRKVDQEIQRARDEGNAAEVWYLENTLDELDDSLLETAVMGAMAPKLVKKAS